jgi:hypothetical protein
MLGGNVLQCASGFQCSKDAALIVTCSHVRNQPQPQEPMARFVAKYVSDGVEEVYLHHPQPLYDLMVLMGADERPRWAECVPQ